MKLLPLAASLCALASLSSCYVWTPPNQPGMVGPQGGPLLNQPPQQQSRYIDTAPVQQQQQQQPQQNGRELAYPQAPNPVQAPPQQQANNQPAVQQQPVTPPPTKPVAPPPPVANTSTSMPYGIKVPSKPGFVLSPHDSSSRIVDVQGIASGTKVKCPYTGKTFLVP